MPRMKERKSSKGLHSDAAMREALHAVKKGMKLATSARQYSVNRSTLRRYCKKFEEMDVIPDTISLTSNYKQSQVFTFDQESELEQYLLVRSSLGHGLTATELRQSAFEYASKNSIRMPETWVERKEAGQEWYLSFMKRHPSLSARTPEACSIARAAAFNKINIDNYFNKLGPVIQRHPNFINGSRKWNLDETSTSTVGAFREKIISPKGQKQVHQIKGHERGTSVTTCCFISALGQSIPPVMIFPRKNFVANMLVGAYPGTLGLANKAGYMTAEMFIPTVKHFIKHTNSSKEEPTMLILDNVGSHLSLECINLCRNNGVILFTLPPHTTHRTQPLDVGVFGPFKVAYDKAVREWTLSNPGIPASIYQVAEFVHKGWSKSATPVNIISAFKATGIHPFNPQIFNEQDFMPSSVTYVDKDQPGASMEGNKDKDTEVAAGTPAHVTPSDSENEPTPSTPSTSSSEKSHQSPLELFGLPKAKPRKSTGRRKGKCMVATDTPEKKEIEERAMLKKKEEEAKVQRREVREQKKKKASDKKTAPKERAKRKILEDFSESDPDDDLLSVHDSSSDFQESGDEEYDMQHILKPLERDPKEAEYVLVEFKNQKKIDYFIGKVLAEKDEDEDLEVSYLRKSAKVKDKFVLPNVPDLASVHLKDIKMILPHPQCQGTRRQQNMLSFNVDLSMFNVQ